VRWSSHPHLTSAGHLTPRVSLLRDRPFRSPYVCMSSVIEISGSARFLFEMATARAAAA
jgi:hypothetical protein